MNSSSGRIWAFLAAAYVPKLTTIDNGVYLHRVEYLILPGNVTQAVAGYIQESGESIQPMKMFYNGAQLVSRGFKEKLQDVFKGTPYVGILWFWPVW
mgnify:CR=1 FL=1